MVLGRSDSPLHRHNDIGHLAREAGPVRAVAAGVDRFDEIHEIPFWLDEVAGDGRGEAVGSVHPLHDERRVILELCNVPVTKPHALHAGRIAHLRHDPQGLTRASAAQTLVPDPRWLAVAGGHGGPDFFLQDRFVGRATLVLQLFQARLELLQLVAPVPAEVVIARAHREVRRIAVSGGRDELAPRGDGIFFRVGRGHELREPEPALFMLHDPVEKYLPAFKNSVVAMPLPKDAVPGSKFVTEKAKRPIQIRDLLTHTAGLTYGDGPASELYKEAKLFGWYFADKDELLAAAIDRLGKLPLHGQPGETFQYGHSTDVLGRLVEVASGLPLDRFFTERIFGPLRMIDSCFFLPPEKEARLAKVYGIEKGQLVSGDQGDYVRGPRKCFSGGAGVLSTAGDYARLLQMLLNDGELDGVRLLGRKTVELMHANHTGDKYRKDTTAFGLGFWVNQDLGYFGELGSEGAYGWGSAYFPQYLVDPKERLVALFMTQHRPSGGNDLNQKFKVLMYQALVK
ncbi:MAG: class A beta-lactamase-related serine hydrolase [Opitutus sp.]|nr:class A beta-lactamase-related serine hydrolase [Opitutus sp.]